MYYYNDVNFDATPEEPVTPPSSAPSRSPGQGNIQIGQIQLSSAVAAPGSPITVSARISGTNIGYIYLFVGLYDTSSNSIYKADTDYLESDNTQEVNGVFYPQWNEGDPFTLEFEWEPTLFQVSNGTESANALFNPTTYGAAAEDAVYTVDGIYSYADGSRRAARMYFRDGVMRQVIGFTDDQHTGGAREIIPQAGDSFTVLENWLDLDTSGQVVATTTEEGATLTFGGEPFRWEEVFAPVGDYVIGIIVEDKDGNTQAAYAQVEVR